MGRSERYLPAIDGLRAVAVTAVVLFHAGVWLPGGYMGVDVFFVISGFVITKLLVAEAVSSGSINVTNFYARRFRRLLPSLVFMILSVLVFGSIFLSASTFEINDLAKSAVAASLFSSNFYFLNTFSDYFASSSDLYPLLHTWSLAVEEQFYIVWPMLILCVFKCGGTTRSTSVVLFLVTALSLTCAGYLSTKSQSLVFYLPIARAWELGVGSIIAVLSAKNKILLRSAALRYLTSWGGTSLLVAAFILPGMDRHFPFPIAIIPVIGTALMLAVIEIGISSVLTTVLASGPFVSIGRLSYAWYLWHWPFLSFARILTLNDPNLARDCGLAALSLVFAFFTTRYVEAPFRFRWGLQLNSRRIAILGLATSLFSAVLGAGVYAAARTGVLDFSPEITRAFRDRNVLQSVCLKGSGEDGSAKLDVRCSDGDGSRRIVLWGDSFADHWAPAVQKVAGEIGARVSQFTKAACPPLLGQTPVTQHIPYVGCFEFNELVKEELSRKPPMALIIAANWTDRLEVQPDGIIESFDFNSLSTEGSVGAFKNGLEATLNLPSLRSVPIIIVMQSPKMPFNAILCTQRRALESCAVDLSEHLQRNRTTTDILTLAAVRRPNVALLDPTSSLCYTGKCPAKIEGSIAYIDRIHVTATVARNVAEVFGQTLRKLKVTSN